MKGEAQDSKEQGLALRLFGPVEVTIDGRPLPPLRSRKSLWLLALLTLRANRPIQRDWLATMLWPDAEHGKALANLRTVMSELRKALGSQGSRLQSIDRFTVALDLEGADVDLIEFDRAIEKGTLEDLRRATSIYRGSLLEGCREEWAFQETTSREKACVGALQKLGEGYLAEEDYDMAIGLFERASAIDPWWDAPRRSTMEALVHQGDVNEALQVYRSYADFLRRESNTAPNERTVQLYESLRMDLRKGTGAPKPKEPAVEGSIPQPLTELVGREDERAEVMALLRKSRLATLTGVGGIGKTRLAIEVASSLTHEFPGGIWFVHLDSVSDGMLVPVQIGAAMGLIERQKDTWLQTVVEHIRAKRLLIVLDNCEHLLDSCAQVTAQLLKECAGLRILATSREALGITGESVWSVPSLAVPEPLYLPSGSATLLRVLAGYEGVQLFIERAKAARNGFSLTEDNARPIAEICYRLEGVPLAIELAASRAKSMTVEQIQGRLGDYLRLLTLRAQSSAPRQHALTSALNWSYDLLTEPERTLLRRLSIFFGGWTLEAAEQVCRDPGADASRIGGEDISDLLTSLVEKSLVVLYETPLGARYRYLEMVRQYASHRLAESSEESAVSARFLDWCLSYAEAAEKDIGSTNQLNWVRRLEADLDNLRAALDRSSQSDESRDMSLRIAGALWSFWHRSGRMYEGRRHMEVVLGRDKAKAPTVFRAKALLGAANLFTSATDPDVRRQLTEESLAIYRMVDDRTQICACLRSLGNAAYLRNDYDVATGYFTEALALGQELGDLNAAGHATCTLGIIADAQHEALKAQRFYEEAILLLREHGDQNMLAWGIFNLADLMRQEGQWDAAQALYEETLSISQSIGFNAVIVSTWHGLGLIADERGDYETAKAYINDSLTLSHKIGDLHGTSVWLRTLGVIAVHEEEWAFARSQFVESLRLTREFGNARGVADALASLGRLDLREGGYASARDAFRESLQIYRGIPDLRGVVDSLEDLAALELDESRIEESVAAWTSASALREKYGFFSSEKSLREREELISRARALLGEAKFQEVWAISCEQPWEQVADRFSP